MSIVTLNDRGVRSVTTFGSLNTGSMVFIKKLTASSSSTLTFLNGSSDVVFDSTYKEYIFTFKDIHPSTNSYTQFQATTDGTNYNTTITNTSFASYHAEADNFAILEYRTAEDFAQSTSFVGLNGADPIGTDNDNCMVGTLHIFNPSSTTFVKHYIARTHGIATSGISVDFYTAGYFNTTSAITGIQFKNESGNIDAGDICLYGIL